MLLHQLTESEESIPSLIKGKWLDAMKSAHAGIFRGIEDIESKRDPIMSGMIGDYHIKLYKIPIRKDRKPMTTARLKHKHIDEWFNEKFGVKARSTGLFATPSFDDAGTYGTPGLVFPIGGDVIWAPEIGDLFFHIGVPIEELSAKLETFDYREGDIPGFIATETSEGMIVHADAYYFLTISDEDGDQPTETDYLKLLRVL